MMWCLPYFLDSLSELPECHLSMVSTEGFLEQLTCISFTPRTQIFPMQLVGNIFVHMAYTPSTHPFLTNPLLITRLLDACDSHRAQSSDLLDSLMLRSVFELISINT